MFDFYVKGKDNGLGILKKHRNLTMIHMIKGLPRLEIQEICTTFESSKSW